MKHFSRSTSTFRNLLICCLVYSGIALTPAALAQQTTPAPLFIETVPLKLKLIGPFDEIKSDKDKNKEYPGILEYVDFDSQTIRFDIKLSARGNSRLASRECRYAPLWLNFKKRQTKGTVFEGQDKLKLAVQCGLNRNSEQWLLKENLAYSIFGELSDLHLKTRMLEVSYIDTDNPQKQRTQLAFLIQHHKSLAQSNNMTLEKSDAVPIAQLNGQQTSVAAIFAYLIGNTDFSFIQGPENDECCHNMKILVDEQEQRFPVPYDFDNTGWVSADYALGPSPNIGIESTLERRFRGLCRHNELLYDGVLNVANKEDVILALIDNATGLSRQNKNRLTKYTSDFFETLASPSEVVTEFSDQCRYSQDIDGIESSD